MPLTTVRKWEQGTRNPSAAADLLLEIIEAEPDAVRRVIARRRGGPAARRPAKAATGRGLGR